MTDTPAAGASVDNKQEFNELQVITDTRSLKGQNIFLLVFPYSVLQFPIVMKKWSPAINPTDCSISFIGGLHHEKSLCLIPTLFYRDAGLTEI